MELVISVSAVTMAPPWARTDVQQRAGAGACPPQDSASTEHLCLWSTGVGAGAQSFVFVFKSILLPWAELRIYGGNKGSG